MSALAHDVVLTGAASARTDLSPTSKDSSRVSSRVAGASPGARPTLPAASSARWGLLIVGVLSAVAYYELLRWNDTSAGLLPGTSGGATEGGSGELLVRGAFSLRDSIKGAPPQQPSSKPALTTRKPSATPSRNPLVVAEVAPLRALGGDNGPASKVCLTSDLCMRASEWDALQATIDCWARPGGWRRDVAAGALHGRKWHRLDGRPLEQLPASMQLAWAPSDGAAEEGACAARHRQPLLPFYKGDFCATLAKRRILLVGDPMNNQFREAIVEGAAPGGKPVFRPRPSRSPRPSPRTQAPRSQGASGAPHPSPAVAGGAGGATDDDDATAAAAAVAAAAVDDYGNATDADESEVVEAVTSEEKEEEAGGAACGAGPADGARNCSSALASESDDEDDEDEAQWKRSKAAAEALLSGSDKDSIGRDGMTEAGAAGREEEDERRGGRQERSAGASRSRAGAEEEGDEEEEQEAEQEEAAAAVPATAATGAGGKQRTTGGRVGGRPSSSLRRLVRFIAAARQAAAAAQRGGSSSSDARPPRGAVGNATPPALGGRGLSSILRGAESSICDLKLATGVEFRRNDRLYFDGDRVPRARRQGYWEFPWAAQLPASDIVILARPVVTQADALHFGLLRRTLARVRAANPRALVIVRNVVPPHVDCDKATGPLYKRQPPGWLSREAALSYGQNEALRLYLRTEFPGVLHLDVATSTALRPDGHSDAPRCTAYTPPGSGPGPLDNWVRLLFNALRLVDLVRLGKWPPAEAGGSRGRAAPAG